MPTPDLPSPVALEEIFRVASELPVAERAAYLETACEERPEMRARVERMLEVGGIAALLQQGAKETVLPEIGAELPRLKPEEGGERISNYKLLQQIGEGGFGVVWVAEQIEPVRRRVALKIIKPGMDTKEVIGRFEQERQALAMMDHSNIARVFDAGATPAGRPFFVMELVKGMPITKYCDEAGLGTRERLVLFGDVCSAINHAHQKGVIHRDIKPSNVMVTLHGDKPVVKVIDFGIAKATQGKLTDKTILTRFEQFIGTPVYMSPEQASMSGLDVDTRSDIYALGVLLYELLTGKPPFDAKSLASAGYEEMRRIIREVEPVKPSLRLSTVAGEERTTLAKARHIEPGKVSRMVEPDLDWIVMKAIEKDRARRYETANGLARDIERHLANEPVLARPASTLYRFRRLVRRNKLAFAAAVIVAASLLAGLGFSTWSFLRERVQHREADQQRSVAKAHAARAAENELHARRLLYASDIALAQEALEQGQLGRARRLLDRHRPQAGKEDLRGWEWRLLWQGCRAEGSAILPLDSGPAFAVSFSPDGRRLAVGYYNGRVELWDAGSRTVTKVLQDRANMRATVVFSPVADALAATGDLGVVKWHNFAAGTETVLCEGKAEIRDMAFSRDGARVAVRYYYQKEVAVVADPSTASVVHAVDLPPGSSTLFHNVCLSPDHERLYVTYGGTENPQLRCIRVSDGETLWEMSGREAIGRQTLSAFTALDVSPDGKVLASGLGFAGRGKIHLWNAESGERFGLLEGHTAWICDLAFSQDGRTLASSSSDQSIRLWDTTTWQESTAPLQGNGNEVFAVAFAPDGRSLATVCKDGAVMLWDAQGRKGVGGRQMLPKNVRSAHALPDSRTVLVGDKQRNFWLIDLPTLRETNLPFAPEKAVTFAPRSFLGVQDAPNRFQLHEITASGATLIAELPIEPRGSFAYCAETRMLAWNESANTIHLTRLDRPAERIDLSSEDEAAVPVRFSADGRFLLATGAAKTAQVWEVGGQRRLPAAEAYFSPFGIPLLGQNANALRGDNLLRWIASATAPTVANRVPSQRLTIPEGFWPVGGFTDRGYSPDGRTFALTTESGTTTLYDARGPEKLATLRGRRGSLFSLAFSPDGTRLVTAHDVLRDMVTRQELIALTARSFGHSYSEFTDDGSTVLVGSHERDGSFFFWRAPSWKEIEDAERSSGGWPRIEE